MSASPDTSFFDQNISELSEDEQLPSSTPSVPRIKLKLRLNPTAPSPSNVNHDDNTSKKHKRKKKRSQKKHKHSNHSDNEGQQHRRHSELVDIDDYEEPSNNGFDDDEQIDDDDKYSDYSHMPVGGKRPFAMLAQDTQDGNDDIDSGTPYNQPVYDEEQIYTDDDQRMDEDDNYVDDYDDEEPDDLNTVYPTDTTSHANKKANTNRSSKTVSKISSKTKGKTSKQSSKDAKAKAAKKRGRPTKKAQARAAAAAMASSTTLPPIMKSQPLKQEHQQYQGSSTVVDHGKGLKATCLKLWDTLSKRDAYGFFLEPVDTKLVRDYLSVIKQPMDFSTLYRKIENDNYKTMDDFRTDFLLIVHNAKLYNAPDTIYWKSADKLENYGIKAIERAEKLVQEPVIPTTQPHRPPFSTYLGNQQYSWQEQQQHQQQQQQQQKNVITVKEEEVDILGLDGPARKASRADSERTTREPSLDPHSRAMTPTRQQQKKKKKKKVADSGVIYGPDGSIHAIGGVNDLHTLLPTKQSFSDPPQLTTINPQALPSAFYQPNRSIHDDWASHKHFQQPAIFCDYGPFPFTTLGSSTPAMFYQQQDARYVYTLYGDDTGEAYLKSMWRFLGDLGLNERATSLSRTITRGAFDVMAAVIDNMDSSNNNGVATPGGHKTPSDDIDIDSDDSNSSNYNNKSSFVLDTELGEVDVGAILSELQRQRRPADDSTSDQQTQHDDQSTTLPPPSSSSSSDEKANVSESQSILATPINTT